MTYANPQSLVSTQWLAEHLHQPDLRIVDGTWYLPSQGKDAKAEYLQRHVPGAVGSAARPSSVTSYTAATY